MSVDGPRNEVFSDSALPSDQYSRVGVRDALDDRLDGPHLRTSVEDWYLGAHGPLEHAMTMPEIATGNYVNYLTRSAGGVSSSGQELIAWAPGLTTSWGSRSSSPWYMKSIPGRSPSSVRPASAARGWSSSNARSTSSARSSGFRWTSTSPACSRDTSRIWLTSPSRRP